MTMT